MNVLDIIILAALAVGIVLGSVRGFFRQLAGMVGLVAGLLVARALYAMVGEALAPHLGTSVSVAQVISFVAIWVIVPLVLNLLAGMLTTVMKKIHLGMLNRFLGGMFGGIMALLWIVTAVRVVEYADTTNTLIPQETKEASACYGKVVEFADFFFPSVKHISEQIMK